MGVRVSPSRSDQTTVIRRSRSQTLLTNFWWLFAQPALARVGPITVATHHSFEAFENQTNGHCDKGCIGREHLGGEMEDALRIAECIDI